MLKEKFFAIMFSSLILATLAGCDSEQKSALPPAASTHRPPSITLGPESSVYTLDEIFKGTVQFAVAVENTDEAPVTFAHPAICFPENHPMGKSLDFHERHGKSEILLTVQKPDGSEVVLRDGPHFFDPNNASHFVIDPGKSEFFYIGWFFQNAQGGWEDDIKAENVFNGRGEYRLRLLYRNFFPKALIHDASTGKSRFIDVWTGEIQSNEVSVTIQ